MFELLVALRYLRSNRKTRAIFSTTLISVLGISVGVFSLNVVLAVMSGFQSELRKTILGASAHVLVSSYEGSIEDHARIEEKIKLVSGVRGVSPVVYGTGLLVSEYGGSQGATVTGINPAVHLKTFPSLFSGERTDGEKSAAERSAIVSTLAGTPSNSSHPPIVLGKGLAGSLGARKGDIVTLVSALDRKEPLKRRPKTADFEVSGVFSYGMAYYDSTTAYLNLDDATEFFQKSGVTSLEVAVEDPLRSDRIARDLESALGFPFVAQSWQEANSRMFSALNLEKLGLMVFLSFIIVIAALSVMSVLLMMMIEKSRDTAILRATGASQKQVGNIFLTIGAALGFTGIFLGTAAAFAICYLLESNETVAGLIPFDPDVYGISKFPVIIKPFYFLIIGVASQIICVFAAFYPAYCVRAGSLSARLKVQ